MQYNRTCTHIQTFYLEIRSGFIIIINGDKTIYWNIMDIIIYYKKGFSCSSSWNHTRLIHKCNYQWSWFSSFSSWSGMTSMSSKAGVTCIACVTCKACVTGVPCRPSRPSMSGLSSNSSWSSRTSRSYQNHFTSYTPKCSSE